MPAALLDLTDTQMLAALVGAAFVLLASITLGYRIGRRKARPVLGVFLGTVFSLLGLAAIAVMPVKEPAYY